MPVVEFNLGPLFDAEWYLKQYPDVLSSGMDPLLHFIKRGAAEGRDPFPLSTAVGICKKIQTSAPQGLTLLSITFVMALGKAGSRASYFNRSGISINIATLHEPEWILCSTL